VHVIETNRLCICVRKTIKKTNTIRTNNSGWWPFQAKQTEKLAKKNLLLIKIDIYFCCSSSFFFLFTNRYYLQTRVYRRESISEAIMRYWYCSIIWYIYFYGGHFSPSAFSRFFAYIYTTYLFLHIVDQHVLLSSIIMRYLKIKFFQQSSGSIYIEIFRIEIENVYRYIPIWIVLSLWSYNGSL